MRFDEPHFRKTKPDDRPPSAMIRDGLCVFKSLEHCLVAAYHMGGKEEVQVCEVVYNTTPKIQNSMCCTIASLEWFILDVDPPYYFRVFTANLKDVCGPPMLGMISGPI